MITEISELRVRIDAIAKYTYDLGTSDQVVGCRTDLLFAKAWLGKLLGSLGKPTPYKNDGKRQDVKDIEPTADTSDSVMKWEGFNHVQRIDIIREDIDKLAYELVDLVARHPSPESGTFSYKIAWKQAWKYLSEARFWLGFELQRVREVSLVNDINK